MKKTNSTENLIQLTAGFILLLLLFLAILGLFQAYQIMADILIWLIE